MTCVGDEVTISFEKFKAAETCTVLIVRYLKGRTQAFDSFSILSIVPVGDTSRSAVAQSISVDYHWTVHLPSLNREYRIANFDFTTERCGLPPYKNAPFGAPLLTFNHFFTAEHSVMQPLVRHYVDVKTLHKFKKNEFV